MSALISIIIPVYNTEKYLSKCVESVTTQTYQNLEIILVDDGSKEPAARLCDEIANSDSRIRVIHKKNGGLSSARNAGIDSALGDFITFLDSDDYVSPTIYEELISVSSDKVIGVSHFVRVDENDKIYSRYDPHIQGGCISSERYLDELLSHTGDVSTCTKLFHKSIIGNHRFDESKLNEDLLFMISLLDNVDELAFTGKEGYFYLCRTDSISSKYGKAIEDMVGNAIVTKDYAINRFPALTERAWRFVLYQHMAYLLLVPKYLQTKENSLYQDAVSYIRQNFYSHGIRNKFLTLKQKIIMVGLIVLPGFLAQKYQKKHSI